MQEKLGQPHLKIRKLLMPHHGLSLRDLFSRALQPRDYLSFCHCGAQGWHENLFHCCYDGHTSSPRRSDRPWSPGQRVAAGDAIGHALHLHDCCSALSRLKRTWMDVELERWGWKILRLRSGDDHRNSPHVGICLPQQYLLLLQHCITLSCPDIVVYSELRRAVHALNSQILVLSRSPPVTETGIGSVSDTNVKRMRYRQ